MSITRLDAYRSARDVVPVQKPEAVAKAIVQQVEVQQVQAQQAQASRADLQAALKNLNHYIAPAVPAIEFSLDDESGKTVVKVIDTETQEVLRQIPNAEALAISKTLDRLQGLIIKQTA